MLINGDTFIYGALIVGYMGTFVVQFRLLYCCAQTKPKDRLSANCLINMFAWCFGSLASIVYLGYMEHCNGGAASGRILFWASLGYECFGMLISSTVVCLLLDRIFYIVSPEAYKRKRTKLIFLTIPLCVCVAFVCVPGLVLSDGFYVGDGQVVCQFGATLKRNNDGIYMTVARFMMGSVNFIFFVTYQFLYCHHSSVSTSHRYDRQFKRANMMAAVACLSNFACAFAPHIIYFVYNMQHSPNGRSKESEEVPYQVVTQCLDGVLTSLAYRFVILKNRSTKIDTMPEPSEHPHELEREAQTPPPPLEEPVEIAVHQDNHFREYPTDNSLPQGRYNSINLSQI